MRFQADEDGVLLIREVAQLRVLCTTVEDNLPEEVHRSAHSLIALERHLSFLEKYLKAGDRACCRQDIVETDLPALDAAFRAWWQREQQYDKELETQTAPLLASGAYDSAIRKAFVLLGDRLRTRSGALAQLDGPALVNAIFGKSATAPSGMTQSEQAAMRDLLAGLYGTFRNPYAHGNQPGHLYQVKAVIAMVNCVLKRI